MPVIGSQINKTEYETYITLAGGRIRCLRCVARSVRSGLQCAKPAMKSSRTQKCSHHGGRSTGPRTAEGKQRLLEAHLVHGESSRAARASYAKDSATLSMLEDSLHVLGMTDAKRRQGRKAIGYRAVQTVEDVQRFVKGLHYV
jgi:hypothetical protein